VRAPILCPASLLSSGRQLDLSQHVTSMAGAQTGLASLHKACIVHEKLFIGLLTFRRKFSGFETPSKWQLQRVLVIVALLSTSKIVCASLQKSIVYLSKNAALTSSDRRLSCKGRTPHPPIEGRRRLWMPGKVASCWGYQPFGVGCSAPSQASSLSIAPYKPA